MKQSTLDFIKEEIQNSQKIYGDFNSTHEVYGVLKEEVDEFFDVVKSKDYYKKDDMIEELQQIASICIRAADQLKDDKIKFV